MANETFANESIITTSDKLGYLSAKLQPVFSDIVVALIVLFIGFIFGKVLGKFLHKLLNELEVNGAIRKYTGIRIRAEELISGIVTYGIYAFAIIFALDALKLTSLIVYIISGAIVLVILISLFITIKDFFPNLVAGMHLYGKGRIRPGDSIHVEHMHGEVVDVGFTETCIRINKEEMLCIPNALFVKKEFKIVRKPNKKAQNKK